MNRLDPDTLFVTDAAPKLERGILRPTDYVESCLRRIEEKDSDIKAWQAVDREVALHQARSLDIYRKEGHPAGPLHGVPFGVQDTFDTFDLPTVNGTSLDAGRRPSSDAMVVARLRAAGAVVLGKTATTELGQAVPGSTRHPADAERPAGGACGGSAAAVAAGMTPLALAMQTAGDVIQAASSCGVVGFKPSYGLVPRTGALRRSGALDTVGVVGRCVEDVALAFDALAGHDASDPGMTSRPPPRLLELSRSDPPLQPSFAHITQEGWANAESETEAGFSELGEALGERWDTIDFPDTFADGIGAHRTLMLSDIAHNLGRYYDRHPEGLCEATRAMIEEGRAIPAINYLTALDWREVLYTGVEKIFSRYEIIVTPAAAGEAPATPTESDNNGSFCILWTLFGLPTVTVPLLEGPNGLPVGVQLVGRRGQDGRLLRTARYLCELVAAQA